MQLNKDTNDPLGYSNQIDYKNSELKIIPPPKNVPYWEQEWDLQVENLLYNVVGWSNSQDLSKMDRNELEKDAVAFYNKLRELLNSGNMEKYMQLSKKEDEELDIVTYADEKQSKIDYENNKSELSELCTGNMRPIGAYQLHLYARGRLLQLSIPAGEYKGWSVLISDTKKGRHTAWSVMLHKPIGSDTFEIIRK